VPRHTSTARASRYETGRPLEYSLSHVCTVDARNPARCLGMGLHSSGTAFAIVAPAG